MLVKMLTTMRGTVNNGLGNQSMDYLVGGVYDAPDEEAKLWIDAGFAVSIIEERMNETKMLTDYENKKLDTVPKLITRRKKKK